MASKPYFPFPDVTDLLQELSSCDLNCMCSSGLNLRSYVRFLLLVVSGKDSNNYNKLRTCEDWEEDYWY